MEMKPDYAHAYNALGYTLAEKTDRLDEAKILIEKALKLQPDDPFILDSLGWVYYRLGQVQEALKHLHTAYTARPIRRSPRTWARSCGEAGSTRKRRRSGARRSPRIPATSRCWR
jgi:tetratricopeptide (TPR) repeat protein